MQVSVYLCLKLALLLRLLLLLHATVLHRKQLYDAWNLSEDLDFEKLYTHTQSIYRLLLNDV